MHPWNFGRLETCPTRLLQRLNGIEFNGKPQATVLIATMPDGLRPNNDLNP